MRFINFEAIRDHWEKIMATREVDRLRKRIDEGTSVKVAKDRHGNVLAAGLTKEAVQGYLYWEKDISPKDHDAMGITIEDMLVISFVPTIYVFYHNNTYTAALTDGTVLANAFSATTNLIARIELGVDSTENHDKYLEACPRGFDVRWLDDVPAGLLENIKHKEEEKRGQALPVREYGIEVEPGLQPNWTAPEMGTVTGRSTI